jgi:hypothetical protein
MTNRPETTRPDGETRWYPAWVCSPCGEKHGNRPATRATWHEGECDICRVVRAVTQPRDFGHLKAGWGA